MDKKTYTKKEALTLMLVNNTVMKCNSNDNFHYYCDGKFYCAGEGEWNPNESSNDSEWVIVISQ